MTTKMKKRGDGGGGRREGGKGRGSRNNTKYLAHLLGQVDALKMLFGSLLHPPQRSFFLFPFTPRLCDSCTQFWLQIFMLPELML